MPRSGKPTLGTAAPQPALAPSIRPGRHSGSSSLTKTHTHTHVQSTQSGSCQQPTTPSLPYWHPSCHLSLTATVSTETGVWHDAQESTGVWHWQRLNKLRLVSLSFLGLLLSFSPSLSLICCLFVVFVCPLSPDACIFKAVDVEVEKRIIPEAHRGHTPLG